MSKILKQVTYKAKRKAHTNIYKIYFLFKAVELIKVTYIFHGLSVKASLPTDIKFDDSTVLYLLTNPISSKIFHFDKFVSNIDVKVFFQDNTILPYNFASSGFIEKDH